MADNILDIKDFPSKSSLGNNDRILVTDSTNGQLAAAISYFNFVASFTGLNAINDARNNALEYIWNQATIYKNTDTDGFYVTDENGYCIFSMTSLGIDAVGLTENFISLIKAISGIGLAIGTTSGTAYEGSKGLKLEKDMLSLSSALKIKEVDENYFLICDANGYVALRIDSSGKLDFAKLGDEAISVLNSAGIGTMQYTTIEEIN